MLPRAMLLALCAATLLPAGAPCAEPDGRPEQVRALIEQLKSPDAHQRANAANSLGELAPAGEAAAQALVEALNDKEYLVQSGATRALAKMGAPVVPRLIQVVREGHGDAPHFAASALAAIGPGAESAVPALLEALRGNDTALRRKAMRALPRVGVPRGEVVETLIALLTDPDAEVSGLAANMLTQQGPLPEECFPRLVPALIRVLENKKWPANVEAMQILGKLGLMASGAAAALTEALKDENPEAASQAAQTLRKIAPAQAKSAAELIQILEDKQRSDRWWAAWTLGGMEPAAQEAAPALAKAARDDNADVRRFATQALWRLGKSRQETAAALIVALRDDDVWVRRRAAYGLRTFGQINEEAGPALAAALKDKDAEVRWRAADALGCWTTLAPKHPEVIAALAAALGDEDFDVRRRATWALERMRGGAKGAVPDLVRLLSSPSIGNRYDAAVALGRIGPDAAEAVPALVQVLEDKDTRVHGLALKAVAGIGPGAGAAAPSVIAILRSGDSLARVAAAEALAALGPPDEATTAALVAALGDADRRVRYAAAGTLVKVGFKGKELVPVLLEEMADKKDSVRNDAAETLYTLGPATREAAVPGLVQIVGSDNAPGRWEAVMVLARFGRAGEAVAALKLARESKDPAVSERAAYFLDEMGPTAMTSAPGPRQEGAKKEVAAGKGWAAKPELYADALVGPYRLAVDRIDRNPAEGGAAPALRVSFRFDALDRKTRQVVQPRPLTAVLDNRVVARITGPGGEDCKAGGAWTASFQTNYIEIYRLEVPAGASRLGEVRIKASVFTPAAWKAFDFPNLTGERLEPVSLGPCGVAFGGGSIGIRRDIEPDKKPFCVTLASFSKFEADRKAWTARTGMSFWPWQQVFDTLELTDASGKRLRYRTIIMPSGGSMTAEYVAVGEATQPLEAEVRNPDGTVGKKIVGVMSPPVAIQYPVRARIEIPESGKTVPAEFILKDIPLPAADEKILFFANPGSPIGATPAGAPLPPAP